MIKELRSHKFPLLGKQVAVFDVSVTALAGYLIADQMRWNKPVTIGSLFVLGHLTHLAVGVETQFSKPDPMNC